MKLFPSIAFTCLTSFCLAQNQNVYFYKNNGDTVSTKEKADFIRIVSEPESSAGVYNVTDYYLNNNRKLVGQSSTRYPVRLEGHSMTFFPNGSRKTISNYKNGRLSGTFYGYYPNGKLYLHNEYFDTTDVNSRFLIKDVYDSLGVAKVTEGNGYYTVYNDTFTGVNEEGPMLNGKRNGLWKGQNEKLNLTFEEQYKNGQLLSGVSQRDGKSWRYSRNQRTSVKFAGGTGAFLKFLSSHVSYPSPGTKASSSEKVLLSMRIETDGTLSQIKILHSTKPAQDQETIKIIESIKALEAAKEYGVPVASLLITPISY